MIAFENGASSMQQISYYEHLSRDDDDDPRIHYE
jgi:hypothetical protein